MLARQAIPWRAQARPDEILLDNELRLMHKSASFRCVFKSPGRITAPVLFLAVAARRLSCQRSSMRALGGPMPRVRRLRNDVILPVQLKREKIPVNFLLFTETVDFALPSVVIANERGGRLLRVPFDSTIGCRRSNGQPFFDIFRKRTQFPQTKPMAKP